MAGNRWQRTLGYETDQAGAEIGSLRLQVTALQDTAVKITGTPITIPEIDSSFTPTFRRDTKKKSGVYVTLAFLIPAETAVLTVKMVRTADRTTSTTFKQSKFSYDVEDITDEERSVQRVVRELYTKGNPLDYETQYDVFRLAAFATAKADSPSVLGENPQVDVLFNDPPLLTFTTPVAFGLPSNPNAALIMANALDGSTRAFDAYTTFRQHAPLTDAGAAQTYAAANVNEAYFEINDPDGKPHKIGGVLNDTELSQVDAGSTPANRGYFERTLYKEYPGGAYSWVRNIAWANGQKKQSTGSAVNYNAAGFSTDPTTLTGVSLTIVTNVDPYTSKFGRIDLVYTQPSTRVGLKNVTVERKRSADSDSTYQVIVKKFSLKDDEYTTTGAHTVVICEGVGFKPSIAYTLRVTIHAIGGATYQFTQTVTTGDNPDVANDTAAPSGLSAPVLAWTAEGRLKITNLQATTNIHTLKKKYIVLYNGTSTYYKFTTNAAAASESDARFEIGLTGHIPLLSAKLKKLRNVFGTSSPTNVYAYWYAENDVNISSKSADSNAVDLTSVYDHQGDRDTIRGLDVEATFTSPGNILGNGDVMLVDGGGDLYNWARWDGTTTPLPAIGGAGYKAISASSNEIAYVASSHSAWMKANTTWQLIQNVKQRFLPGETYNITIFLRADTAITATIKLHLYNLERPVLTGTMNLTSSTSCVGTGTLFLSELAVGDQIVVSSQKRTIATITDDTHLTVTSAFSAASGNINVIIDNINNTIAQSLSLTTSNQLFGAVFSMKSSPNLASTAGGTDYVRHQFGIEFSSNTDDIYLDKFMCVRGEQPMAYAPRGDEVDSLASATIVPSYIAAPDIVRISGTDGGWKLPDTGGFITVNTTL